VPGRLVGDVDVHQRRVFPVCSFSEPGTTVPSPPMAALLRQLRDSPASSLGIVSPQLCARILDVDGICASRFGVDNGLITWHLSWCSDATSKALNDLRSQLVEGPGVRAVLRNTSVLVPDLATPSVQERWPTYASAALGLGIRAVFAFPLRRLAAPFGAIIAYRRMPGFLTSIDDAKEFTEVAAQVLAA
jgi:hypothetical protein